jgi:hypothetical protein
MPHDGPTAVVARRGRTQETSDARLCCSLLVLSLLVASVHSAGQPSDPAQAVLSAAREALGGETKLSAVKTFTATGRTRQIRGNNLVPIEFEINCELPDKDVRRDGIPAQDTDPTTRAPRRQSLPGRAAPRSCAGHR